MMQLLALKCPTCGQKLTPQSNETVVVSCMNCLTAVSLHQAAITAIPIQYAAPTARGEVETWLPMWVYNGRVALTRRQSQSGSKGADKEAQALWGGVQRLYAPAWQEPVSQAREIGSQFILKQPALQATTPEAGMTLRDATITQEDGLKLLDFIVLTIEANRKDWLKDLQFEIQTSGSELWAVPVRQKRGVWEFLV
jgi:hypothetical protein